MNMKEKLTIIKVGGKIVEEEDSLHQLLAAFTAVEGHKILVHGGGRSATKVAAQLGIESQMINGRRVTDPVKDVDYGFVGDVDAVNGTLLADLIRKGIVPVMAPLTHDGQGHILNTNADTIAGETAKAMADAFDVTLMYCFEKKGVLRDAEDDDSLIPHINESEFKRYVEEGIIQGGMIPKLENSFEAIHAGVSKVIITLATAIDSVSGTVIER